MKVGDHYDCPKCGKNSFLKKESLMDGWTKLGEVLKCASCGAEAERILSGKSDDAKIAAEPTKKNTLLDLLGEQETPKANQEFLNEEKRFCRDCAHLIVNAFRTHCSKYEKDVSPMGDCKDFTKRKTI